MVEFVEIRHISTAIICTNKVQHFELILELDTIVLRLSN